MQTFTQEQSKKIYQDAKSKGLDAKKVIYLMAKDGAVFDGVDMNGILSYGKQNYEPKEAPKQSFVQDVKSAVQERNQNVQDIQKMREQGQSVVGEVLNTVAPSVSEKVSPLLEKIQKLKSKVATPNVAQLGQSAGLVNDIIGAGLSAITPDSVKKFGTEAIQKIVPDVLAQAGLNTIEDYNAWAEKNPLTAKNIEGVVNIASLLPIGKGVQVTGTVVKEGGEQLGKQVIESGAKTVGNIANKAKIVTGNVVSKITPESETIMNRVARLNPTDAKQFEKLAGKSHGKYLQETGNFGTPDEIVTKEAEKFLQSKQAVDNALAQLPGKYQAPEITKVYDEVIEKLQKTESPEANKWISLRSQYDKSGFDMSTINDLKRVYEREVKIGYNKLNNPDAVKLATNRDNALRNWQTKQADILGFENISEMNKQTQLAKFVADKLGDQIVGKSGLNGMSLTDWIMLSGGDPTAIGGLLTKKFFSDPGVQSKIAKMLSKVETQGMIKPKIGETKLPRLEAGKTQTPSVSSGSTIQVAPKGANVEFTGQIPGVIPKKKR